MWSSCFNPLELCSVLTRPERGWLTFYKDMDDLKEKKKKKLNSNHKSLFIYFERDELCKQITIFF